MTSATRSPMRSRNAAPTSRFLPEMRKDIAASDMARSQKTDLRQDRAQPKSILSPGYLDLGIGRRRVNATRSPLRERAASSRSGSCTLPCSVRNCALLLATPLHRGGDPHGLAVFRDGPAGDVDAGLAQFLDDGIVREHAGRGLGIDQLLDAVPYGLI